MQASCARSSASAGQPSLRRSWSFSLAVQSTIDFVVTALAATAANVSSSASEPVQAVAWAGPDPFAGQGGVQTERFGRLYWLRDDFAWQAAPTLSEFESHPLVDGWYREFNDQLVGFLRRGVHARADVQDLA